MKHLAKKILTLMAVGVLFEARSMKIDVDGHQYTHPTQMMALHAALDVKSVHVKIDDVNVRSNADRSKLLALVNILLLESLRQEGAEVMITTGNAQEVQEYVDIGMVLHSIGRSLDTVRQNDAHMAELIDKSEFARKSIILSRSLGAGNEEMVLRLLDDSMHSHALDAIKNGLKQDVLEISVSR